MLLDFYQKNCLNVPKSKDKSSFASCITSKACWSINSQCPSKEIDEYSLEVDLSEKDSSSSKNYSTNKKAEYRLQPRIKYSIVNTTTPLSDTSTSPDSSVIPPSILYSQSAAAIAAAAFLRGEYRNAHQIESEDFSALSQGSPKTALHTSSKNENFYISPHCKTSNSDHKLSSNGNQKSQFGLDDENEDESQYPPIDDIHIVEGSKSGFFMQNMTIDNEYMSDESHKYSLIAAQALRNLEYSLSDYSGHTTEEQLYNCRHCGKKYRWKSTLRRHENVECGGKEPSHQCPYCPYKSKQRGNLGVHVRKHHANLPQLASKRRSKYSQQRD